MFYMVGHFERVLQLALALRHLSPLLIDSAKLNIISRSSRPYRSVDAGEEFQAFQTIVNHQYGLQNLS